MKEYMDERKSGNTKVYIVLLGVALIIALLWVTGLIRWADSSKEQEMQVINTEVPQGQRLTCCRITGRFFDSQK